MTRSCRAKALSRGAAAIWVRNAGRRLSIAAIVRRKTTAAAGVPSASAGSAIAQCIQYAAETRCLGNLARAGSPIVTTQSNPCSATAST